MHIASRLLTILILISLTGCIAAVAGGAAAGGYYVGKDERTAGRIAESIKGVEGVTSNLSIVPVEVEELD